MTYKKVSITSIGTNFLCDEWTTPIRLCSDALPAINDKPAGVALHKCFNCVYSLYYTLKGWYRHRDTAIRQAVDAAEPNIPQESEEVVDETDNLTYIPFEEFQKTL